MTELERPLPDKRATRALARELAPLLAGGDLLILTGVLGAGKTFFARELARALGLPAGQRVTSPTFTLVHEYGTEPKLVHADLYRLEGDLHQLGELGLLPARDDGALLVVEWGLPFERALGGDALVLTLERDPRKAVLSATGRRSQQQLAALVPRASESE
jgi:tRNA threonylcarbamoyladenosine biosynthesis protein TsaE